MTADELEATADMAAAETGAVVKRLDGLSAVRAISTVNHMGQLTDFRADTVIMIATAEKTIVRMVVDSCATNDMVNVRTRDLVAAMRAAAPVRWGRI